MTTNREEQKDTPEMVLAIVDQLVREVHPVSHAQMHITLDSSFDRDLGLDSLTRVELLSRVEKSFQVALPERVLATAETPRDLLRVLETAGGAPPVPAGGVGLPAQPVPAGSASAPVTAATLGEVLRYHAENHPERLHIRLYRDEDEGETITYGELWREASTLAAGLQHLGLAVGEAVLIMLPTGREYFLTFAGILLAGGVPVPLYPPGRAKQIEEHLRRHAAIAANCLARMMVTMPEAVPFARLMHQQVPTLARVATAAEILAAGREQPLHPPHLSAGDTAFLQYTSGSTGMPKGVVLSHANLLANIRAMGRAAAVSSADVFVSWLPLYHDMGLIGAWLGSLYYACPLVIMSPLTFLARPLRWLTAISRFGGTLSAGPNFAYELCRRRITEEELAGLDLSSWRCAFNGAEAVSPATIAGFSARFAGCGFAPTAMMPVYGLAESSVGLAFPPLGRGVRIEQLDRARLMTKGVAEPAAPDDPAPLTLAACGLPLPGHQIRIVDRNDRELPDRQEGQVQFLGPSSTSGYFRNPEQTRALFHGPWLDSGDLGYLADGELFITGRSKDIIIKAGRNIYPMELEEAVGELAGIRRGNVAVFGGTDLRSGSERLVVLAETRKRRPEELADLRSAINTIVSDLTGSAPDEVVLAPPNTVPKTSSGKIRRRASRDLYEKGEIGRPGRPVWLQLAGFVLAGSGTRLRQGWRQLGILAYAAYCWLLFGLAAPFSCLAVALLPTLASRWRFNRALVRLAFRLAGLGIKVEGLGNLPGPGVPCVLAVNHASYLDALILAGALPYPFAFVAKAELRGHRLLRWLLPRLGVVFVERFAKEKGAEDSQRLGALAGSGRSLLFFVEGTFMRMPGLLPFRLGAFETAIQGGRPMVPVAIRGSRPVLRGDTWFPRRGRLRVIIGEPVDSLAVRGQAAGDRWRASLVLRDQVRSWLLTHTGEPDLEHERDSVLSGPIPPA
ncbi:MAG TPA: AMP-binding protein [Desulfurivibrionaceae bacterium]|nr:AMP-binding protein [Desulfurivibrionaceae bacterium]